MLAFSFFLSATFGSSSVVDPNSFLNVFVFFAFLSALFGYSNVLGMHAFGLVENGAYSAGEERAEVALALQPKDMWAVHAMAHVYEMEVTLSPLRQSPPTLLFFPQQRNSLSTKHGCNTTPVVNVLR